MYKSLPLGRGRVLSWVPWEAGGAGAACAGLCGVHSPQRAARLLIRGAPVADVAEGVAGLQFGFLALRDGLSFLPLAEELLERLELACLFLVCRWEDRAALGWAAAAAGSEEERGQRARRQQPGAARPSPWKCRAATRPGRVTPTQQSAQTSAPGFRDLQPNICIHRKDNFAKPGRNAAAVFLGFIPKVWPFNQNTSTALVTPLWKGLDPLPWIESNWKPTAVF